MRTSQQDLIPGETVNRRARLHWLVLFWPAVVTTILGLLGVEFLFGMAIPGGSFEGSLILAATGWSLLLTTIVAAAIAFEGFKSAEAIITNKRVIVVYRIFWTRSFSIPFSTIESTMVRRGILGRALDCGTIVVRQRGGPMKRLRNFPHPFQFQRYLEEQLQTRE